MPSRVAPCLMFVGDQLGRAEEAMELYVGAFGDAEVLELERFGPEEEPANGIRWARFRIGDQVLRAMDSPGPHQFTFTPAISLFIDVDTEDELDAIWAKLATDDAAVLMPLQAYPFSPRFGWVRDRFGVTWQLNLAA